MDDGRRPANGGCAPATMVGGPRRSGKFSLILIWGLPHGSIVPVSGCLPPAHGMPGEASIALRPGGMIILQGKRRQGDGDCATGIRWDRPPAGAPSHAPIRTKTHSVARQQPWLRVISKYRSNSNSDLRAVRRDAGDQSDKRGEAKHVDAVWIW